MLETVNDYLSFGVLIFIVFAALKMFIGAIREDDTIEKKRNSVLFDYINNEDE